MRPVACSRFYSCIMNPEYGLSGYHSNIHDLNHKFWRELLSYAVKLRYRPDQYTLPSIVNMLELAIVIKEKEEFLLYGQ